MDHHESTRAALARLATMKPESAFLNVRPDADAVETVDDIVDPEQARSTFVIQEDGRTFLTGRAGAAEFAATAGVEHPGFLYLGGRFVGAEQANSNHAYWSLDDLAFGEPTVAHGPLNWLHDEKFIVGTIADSRLVRPSLVESAEQGGRPYIAAAAVMWKYIYGAQAAAIEQASEAGNLWYSMECVSKTVACLDHGCGEWTYPQYMQGGSCDHIKVVNGRRESAAQFKNPIFLGGAVIIPPVSPGWSDAHLRVMERASHHAEKAFAQAGKPDVDSSTWERLVASVLMQVHDKD